MRAGFQEGNTRTFIGRGYRGNDTARGGPIDYHVIAVTLPTYRI
jgi:hypothetical protein